MKMRANKGYERLTDQITHVKKTDTKTKILQLQL